MLSRPALLALLAAVGLGCGGPRRSGPLDRPVTPRLLAESGPLELFPLCSEIKTPCGWEMLPSQAGRSAGVSENSYETDTARSFLDRFVARRPEYRWFMMSGVLNVAPRDVGSNNPLDRPAWADVDGLAADAALEKLVASADLRLTKSAQAEDYPGAAGFGRVTFKARGLRLRLALNRLVAADGRSMWWCAPAADPDEVRCGLLTWRGAAE